MRIRNICGIAWLGWPLVAAGAWTDLWPGEAPGAARPAAGVERVENDRISRVEVPQYWLYQADPAVANGAAVVILPGGGYTILAAGHEGRDYATWLNERGITAVVVKYRVADDDSFGYGHPVPYLDARRAIRLVRAHAEEWGVDPEKVGVMGSSAGGHLASVCATRFADEFEEEAGDEWLEISARPDFAVLVYPVITMGTDLSHGGSRRRLLGEEADEELVERLSTERAVGPETPPTFLLTTADDFVDARNSLRFAAACKEHGVPVALHLFPTGGHGYGLGGEGPVAAWPGLLEAWLEALWNEG